MNVSQFAGTKTDPNSRFSAEITEPLSTFDKPTIDRIRHAAIAPDLSHLPGSRGLPMLGHTSGFLRNFHELLNQEFKKHGPVFRLQLPVIGMGKEIVVMLGPDANRLIYQNENKVLSNYLSYGVSSRGLFDDSVLFLDFDHHRQIRKSLQIAFKRPAIESHMELMNPLVRNGVDLWPLNKTIRSTQVVKNLLLNVGSVVFLGSKAGPETDRLARAFDDVVAGSVTPFRSKFLPFSTFSRALKARATLERYIFSNIDHHRKQEGQDMFSQLCHARDEDGNLFSDQEIANQILFILFAAHDTTTSALSSIFFALASDQAWQEELREEMFSLGKEDLEFNDIDKLYKSGLTFKEALRMYPPAALIPRRSIKSFQFSGHTIPANTGIMGFTAFSHYMPEYWSEPHSFDPMRFSEERAEDKKDFFQYAPFGGGIHKCLGLHFATVQGRMVLFNLLKKYRITKHPKMRKYKFNNIPLTFPTDGMPLTFTKI